MSLIIFIFILSILILVHEWGHYIMALRCGVRVEQFALGFGPKLFSWKTEHTEFCLCAIPLGGFVKMAGDEREKCAGKSDEFFSKSCGPRALIILMGPVVNLILAYLCFWVVFQIGFVDIEASQKNVPAIVGQILKNSPAQQAGLALGDKIINIDGKVIDHWPTLQDAVTHSTKKYMTFVVQRSLSTIKLIVMPQDQDAQDIFGRHHKIRRIGVGPKPITDARALLVKRYGFFQSFIRASEELAQITVKTYVALYEIITGQRSAKEAMGIIGIFFVVKFALTVGFSFLLHIVGLISASLAIFNLLPLIPLDGGHLFFIGLEKLRGKALSIKADQWVTKTGFIFIIILALFVFYADFERIGLIDKIAKIFKIL